MGLGICHRLLGKKNFEMDENGYIAHQNRVIGELEKLNKFNTITAALAVVSILVNIFLIANRK